MIVIYTMHQGKVVLYDTVPDIGIMCVVLHVIHRNNGAPPAMQPFVAVNLNSPMPVMVIGNTLYFAFTVDTYVMHYMKLANADGVFSIRLGEPAPSPQHRDAFERLIIHGWVIFNRVCPVVINGPDICVYHLSPMAKEWLAIALDTIKGDIKL